MRVNAKASIKQAILLLILLLFVCLFTSCGKRNSFDGGDTQSTTDVSLPSETPEVSTEPIETTPSIYCVTFITDDGIPIKSMDVKAGGTVMPPEPPRIAGKIFTGWSEFERIVNDNCTVTATYKDLHEQNNVIVVNSNTVKSNQVFDVTVGIYGDVCICGLDIKLTYDVSKLELVEVADEDSMVITNPDKDAGVVYLNYASVNNTTGEFDFCKLRFKAITEANKMVEITVTSIYYVDATGKIKQAVSETVPGKIIIMEEKAS